MLEIIATLAPPRGRSPDRITAEPVRPAAFVASRPSARIVRRAVQRNLERLGYHVIAAGDGEEATRIAGTLDGIDLLLSDVVMPGIDGPELACRLRAKWRDLPVLFVTGYSADRLSRSGAVGPHDRVLEKPYQFDELARTIRGMLESQVERRAVDPPPAA